MPSTVMGDSWFIGSSCHDHLNISSREGLEPRPSAGLPLPSDLGTWLWRCLRDRHFGCVEIVVAEKSVLLEFEGMSCLVK